MSSKKFMQKLCRSHIGLAKEIAFRKHEKKLMLKFFSVDLDEEIKNMRNGDYISVKVLWRTLKKGDERLKNFTHNVFFKRKSK